MNEKVGIKKRVLVVDDEPGMAHVLGIKLRLHGFEVISAANGTEGIDLARTQKPDIILLDIVMPDLSGFDVLDQVRTFSQIPIIMFTARPELARFAKEVGADDTIAKPFDPDKIVEKINLLLSKPPSTKVK